MNKPHGRVVALSGGLLLAALLSGCTTLGDAGPAICHADDGTMVPVNDSRCPQATRDALHRDAPAPISIDQQMNNQNYDAQHGLIQGDAGYR